MNFCQFKLIFFINNTLLNDKFVSFLITKQFNYSFHSLKLSSFKNNFDSIQIKELYNNSISLFKFSLVFEKNLKDQCDKKLKDQCDKIQRIIYGSTLINFKNKTTNIFSLTKDFNKMHKCYYNNFEVDNTYLNKCLRR